MRALIATTFVVMLGSIVFPYGSLELGLSLLPSPTLEAELLFGGEVAGFTFESTSILHWDTWVWQEFAGTGEFGPISVEAKILFGPSTIDFIYDELILSGSVAGLEFGFYAAQLSDAVLGGPASGAAVRVAGSFGGISITSITEFGATPEGIEIFHAASGISRKYTTDPRSPGNGLTAQRLSLAGISLPCAGCPEASLELYFTKERGFEHLSFAVEDFVVWCCPEIEFALEVSFEVQTKSVAIEPSISVAPACFIPYFEVEWSDGVLDGLDFAAFEIGCELPNGKLRSVTILKRCCWGISTPEYGSQVVRCFEADEEGIECYPDYWELLSVEVEGPGCCGGEWRALFNTYFGEPGTLFGWGRVHLELEVPLSPGISASGRLIFVPTGVEEFLIAFAVRW